MVECAADDFHPVSYGPLRADGSPAVVCIYYSEDDAGLARWMLRKPAAEGATADRKLAALERKRKGEEEQSAWCCRVGRR